jgi:20S proteasome alpha/beta subunit
MTTILWDGHNLIGDKQAGGGSGIIRVTKIWRLSDGRLVGASGWFGSAIQWRDWLERGGERPAVLGIEDGSIRGLEVLPDRSVLMHDTYGAYPVESAFVAIGSGSPFAMGAMAAGATGMEAMRIAARLDEGTSAEVDVLVLAP